MPGNLGGESRDLAKTGQAVSAVAASIAGEVAKVVETKGSVGAELDGLSGEQRQALEWLASGKSVTETARQVGLSRTTVYDWLKRDPVFQAAYNKWHEMIRESCRAKLATLIDKATGAVAKALEAGDARAAIQLLNGMGMISPRGKKSTDPEMLKRKAAVKAKQVEDKLRYEEMYSGVRPRERVTRPVAELG